MKHPIGYDKRPRFGWCDNLDSDPMLIAETQEPFFDHPVVVIPLPRLSRRFMAFVRRIFKGQEQNIWA